MPSYRSIKELHKHIKKGVNSGLQLYVANRVKEIIKGFIITNLYQNEEFDPKVYQRTEQFMNTVTVAPIEIVGNHATVEIFIDGTKLEMVDMSKDGLWNKHASSNMEDVRNALPYWLEQGTPNDGSNFHPREGAWFMRDSKEFIESKQIVIKSLIIYLKQNGIKVT